MKKLVSYLSIFEVLVVDSLAQLAFENPSKRGPVPSKKQDKIALRIVAYLKKRYSFVLMCKGFEKLYAYKTNTFNR
ncbi:hypothetical protein CJF42_06185 [Pseudoalteromonas sp. NBT06-2]|nr:hypothetical protein CJF42_06185 [Pseudoalteromonas sp. NBT06-2]